MIETSALTKRYVGHTAVDQISFQVGKGEIVGFLGPNGAGKSTTIRMLTCFLTPTSGTAKVAGFDIETDSIKVRERVGYMPENVPLYPDMRVGEYLFFRAGLKGLAHKEIPPAVNHAMELCALTGVKDKIIGTLSKGFRQRVGLADALVNDPELLILDEPTNGLDPQQIRQFRQLIKSLGESRTIFLSTHILPEVEMTCNRVIIINRGHLEASDTPENLIRRQREGSDVVLDIRADAGKVQAALEKMKGVSRVEKEHSARGWSRFRISADGKTDVCESLFDLAVERKWKIRELSRRDVSLEDAFVNLVKQDHPEVAGNS